MQFHTILMTRLAYLLTEAQHNSQEKKGSMQNAMPAIASAHNPDDKACISAHWGTTQQPRNERLCTKRHANKLVVELVQRDEQDDCFPKTAEQLAVAVSSFTSGSYN